MVKSALFPRYRKPGPSQEVLGIDPKQVPEVDRESFYRDCRRHGLFYGPAFQPVEASAVDRTCAKLRYPNPPNPPFLSDGEI